MNIKILLFVIMAVLIYKVNAQDIGKTILQENPFSFEAFYVGDLCYNFKGGIKRGSAFLGMGNLKLGFDTRKARLWKGGQIFINGATTHGDSPSGNLVGDFQVISNLDAGDHIYLHELWFKQSFGPVELTLGLQDLNVEFLVCEQGVHFLNSSFGVPPVVSSNIPAPIFPLTAIGITFKCGISKNATWLGAVYDGCQTAYKHNVYNTNWHLKPEDGLLLISEMHYSPLIFKKQAKYKAGIYYHTGLKQADEISGELQVVFKDNKGLYCIIDQDLWIHPDSIKKLGVFVQFAASPRQNINNYYIGGGLTFSGLFLRDRNDVLCLGIAHAGFNGLIEKHETTVELSYRYNVNENIYVKPDVQYVMNPMGTGEDLDDALVGILRFGLNF